MKQGKDRAVKHGEESQGPLDLIGKGYTVILELTSSLIFVITCIPLDSMVVYGTRKGHKMPAVPNNKNPHGGLKPARLSVNFLPLCCSEQQKSSRRIETKKYEKFRRYALRSEQQKSSRRIETFVD